MPRKTASGPPRWVLNSAYALLAAILAWAGKTAVNWVSAIEHRVTVLETRSGHQDKTDDELKAELRRLRRFHPNRERTPTP